MEKIIIKNFGPIKDVEIDLKKYVILIGDTSTGKSVIAKLVSIFNELVFNGIREIQEFKNYLVKHNIQYLKKNSLLKYSIGSEFIQIKENKIETSNHFEASAVINDNVITDLEKLYSNLIRNNNSEFEKEINELENLFNELKKNFNEYKNIKSFNYPLYIPTERIIFSMAGSSLAGLWANNINISQSYKDFAAVYEQAKEKIKFLKYESLKFDYHFEKNKEYIIYNKKKIGINEASSGIQSILPLILTLNYILNENLEQKELIKSITIEEPEISLFPTRQKELIEYIVSLFNKNKARIVITTHSPYILSTFNNLILANNSSIENKKRKKEIKNIIEEKIWIDYEKISVYEVSGGKVLKLNDNELKNININAIDSASDIISEQTDKLIEIRYEG